MKHSIFYLIILLTFLASIESHAQLKLIHYWHFNNTMPADGSGGISYGPNPIYTDYSSTSLRGAVVYKPINSVSADTGTVDNCKGKSKNDRQGYGGCCGAIDNGLRTRNPSDNMEFLWYIPTGNYKNIVITYATESSSFKSGMHQQLYSYSLDSGKTFVTTGLPVLNFIPDTVWGKVVLNLQAMTSFNNNNKLVFRILYSGQNTGAKGNNRYDNITVEGDSLMVDGVNNIEDQIFTLNPNPANESVQISASNETTKTVELYSSLGTIITKFQFSGNQYILNTSKLCPGFYYVNITNGYGTTNHKLKFIKE